jgi:hypothetical protein
LLLAARGRNPKREAALEKAYGTGVGSIPRRRNPKDGSGMK